MLDPSLILLDEPAAGVNPIMQNKIIESHASPQRARERPSW